MIEKKDIEQMIELNQTLINDADRHMEYLRSQIREIRERQDKDKKVLQSYKTILECIQ